MALSSRRGVFFHGAGRVEFALCLLGRTGIGGDVDVVPWRRAVVNQDRGASARAYKVVVNLFHLDVVKINHPELRLADSQDRGEQIIICTEQFPQFEVSGPNKPSATDGVVGMLRGCD